MTRPHKSWGIRASQGGAVTVLALAGALALALTTTGCQVRRTSSAIAPPLNELWMEETPHPDTDQSKPLIQLDQDEDLAMWWTHLSSPVLDQLVSHAQHQNLDLREACWRIVEARALRRSAIGRFQPNGDWKSVRHDRRQSRSGNAILPAGVGDSFAAWSTGLDATWELGLFRRLEHLRDATQAKYCAAVEHRRHLLVVLLAEIAEEYVRARSLQQRLLVAEANLRLQRVNHEVANTRWESGLTSELDVAQAASQLRLTESRIPALRADLQAAANRICLLMGQPPVGRPEELLGPGNIPQAPTSLSIGMPADLLRRRPDVREAQQEVIAESAGLGLTEAELLPHLAVTGAITMDARSFSSLFNGGSLAYTLGPTLRWNLLNRGRVKADVEAQWARLQQAIAGYERAVLAAAEEAETALNGFVEQLRRAGTLEQAVHAASRAAELATAQYRDGLVSMQAVIDSHQRKLDAEDLWKQSQGEVIRQLIRTYRALGGGWEQPPPAPLNEFVVPDLRLSENGRGDLPPPVTVDLYGVETLEAPGRRTESPSPHDTSD